MRALSSLARIFTTSRSCRVKVRMFTPVAAWAEVLVGPVMLLLTAVAPADWTYLQIAPLAVAWLRIPPKGVL